MIKSRDSLFQPLLRAYTTFVAASSAQMLDWKRNLERNLITTQYCSVAPYVPWFEGLCSRQYPGPALRWAISSRQMTALESERLWEKRWGFSWPTPVLLGPIHLSYSKKRLILSVYRWVTGRRSIWLQSIVTYLAGNTWLTDRPNPRPVTHTHTQFVCLRLGGFVLE